MSVKALQEYTRFSKYAKYVPELKRRETWDEQVTRVFEMHKEKFGLETIDKIKDDFDLAEKLVRQKRILGSQRALQFGGTPILTKHERLYNCTVSYIDRPRFFQECMFLLLCGCGVGFSVQKHHVEQLPKLSIREKRKKTYTIPDSIEGWADAIGVLMSSYFGGRHVPFTDYQGHKVEFNFSKIRPAGAPISSGSKAPGPEGLKIALEKIEYLLEKVLKLEDGVLKPIDAYDIVMHASDAVLSGGVRRSATICLFSPEDEEMAKAKTGSWFIDNPQRGRSNNSALLIRDEATREQFDALMQSVKEYGEPGFIWAEDKEALFNPCVTADSWIFTDKGPMQVSDLIGKQFNALVNGNKCKSTDKGFFKTGTKKTCKILSKEGFELRATDNHQFLVKDGKEEIWKELKDIGVDEEIVIHSHKNVQWNGCGTNQEGWLLGSLIGDGCFSKGSACLDYWGETRYEMNEQAVSYINESGLQTYHNITGGDQIARVGKRRLYSVGLYRLAVEYGITEGNKEITDLVEYSSSDFHAGFLRGYFDADGSVQGDLSKGVSVRLYSINKNNLKRVQRMLLRMGIYSKIYLNRREAGYRNLPDGNGGLKEYYCQSGHELIISRDSIIEFENRIGFSEKEKAIKLNDLISSYKRKPNKSKFVATVSEIIEDGIEDVYDCTIPEVHAFDANGFYAHNCVEIGFYAYDEKGRSGFSFCNLCEINSKKASTEEEFYEACRGAATLGTLQAAYTDFPYLGKVSESIVRSEALLGVSMTGMADNPEIAFNDKIQRKGAKLILEVNERIAAVIGINKCARGTCIKPAGTTSCILGTASGIHPHHAKRYFRRVQANKMETPLQFFKERNPLAVEESVWSSNKTDVVVTFLCEVPDGVKTKNQVDALTLLETVRLTQQNWVEAGTRPESCLKPWLRHNVSNTINVKPDEWDSVASFIYRNRKWFAGISLIPMSGDKDYPQAPFTAVFTPNEIVREYGDASVFASGLIVDGLRAFDDNLWAACDCAMGIGEILNIERLRDKIKGDYETNGTQWRDEGLSPDSPDKLLNAWLRHNVDNYNKKVDWVRRAKQFATRYFQDDVRKMTYCLKDVVNWKKWCDLSREYVDIDWQNCFEDDGGNIEMGGAGEACSGGKCDLGDLGLAIEAKTKLST